MFIVYNVTSKLVEPVLYIYIYSLLNINDKIHRFTDRDFTYYL
jgi:hypothetical protein